MTNNERLEQVEKELFRMKRFNRWLLMVLCVIIGLFVLIGGLGLKTVEGQIGEKIIRANKFVVEDQTGKVQAILGMSEFGPMLSLYNEECQARFTLSIKTGEALMSLADRNGNIRFTLGKDLTLYDRSGNTQIKLVTEESAAIHLYGINKKTWMLLTAKGEDLVLGMWDKNNVNRVGIGLTASGPNIVLCDARGNPFWSTPE